MGETILSLYEYLGKAAGPKLGREVNKVAQETKQPYFRKYVKQGWFEGEVFMYPKSFLDEYFKK